MTTSVLKTQRDRDQAEHLLGLPRPEYRRAYSDRTAWLMACLSELAYIRFNDLFGGAGKKGYFLEQMMELIERGGDAKQTSTRRKLLNTLVQAVAYDPAEEKARLIRELGELNLSRVEEFDNEGTQAILVKMPTALVLAFRGTEAMSIKDIKADANAKSRKCYSGGKVHSGFDAAYESVANLIIKKLENPENAQLPLYITGHSLGGALATISAKRLEHSGGIAACYTFGSPRVGDEEWISSIKAPVYRLVNAADCVTMLPPGKNTVTVIAWMVQFIPWGGSRLRKLVLSLLDGYMHCGDMRFLTNVKQGAYDQTRLVYSVSLLTRLRGLWEKQKPWRSFLADHSIAIYRSKLAHVAQSRNKDSVRTADYASTDRRPRQL